MRNYFSQLAKQSGLRIAAERSEKTHLARNPPTAPLDQERTIMVSPDPPAAEIAGAPLIAPNVVEKKTQAVETVFAEDIAGVKSEAAESSTPQYGSDPRFQKQTEDSVAANQAEDSIAIPIPEAKSPEAPPAASAVAEQIVFVEPDAPGPYEIPPRRDSEDRTLTLQTTAESRAEQKYFVKTSEILEKGGEASHLEIQHILFQEVQQWAADAPDHDGTEIVEAARSNSEMMPPPVAGETVFALEKTDWRATDAESLEEQSLSLSIGTISIVIEDAEKTPAPENLSVVRRSNESRSETKRRFSSLRRNYL